VVYPNGLDVTALVEPLLVDIRVPEFVVDFPYTMSVNLGMECMTTGLDGSAAGASADLPFRLVRRKRWA
jgi:hypothetical protein